MSSTVAQALVYQKLPSSLPGGCAAVPVVPGSQGPVRLCVVVKLSVPPGSSGTGTRMMSGPGGPFIPLRESYDASVLLGCLADASGRVHQWVELWCQRFDTSSPKMSTAKEVLSNRSLDKQWAARCERFAERTPGGVMRTGFEEVHPEPTLIDLRRGTAMRCTDPRTGKAWSLCEDDRLLESKGLPAYSTSLYRYLYQAEADSLSPFVAVTPGAPKGTVGAGGGKSGEGEWDVREALGLSTEVAIFNPGGGLLMVTPHAPVGLENYLQALTQLGTEDASLSMLQTAARVVARSFDTPSNGNLTASAGVGGAGDEASMFFLSRHGLTGRLLETLYHKLAVLAAATAEVRTAAEHSQQPLLNLTAHSFRVHVGAQSSVALPFLWSSRVVLATPGSAVALPVQATDRLLFGSMEENRSVYNAAGSARSGGGMWGELRIRRVQMQDEQVIVEGTLTTQERVAASSRDSVWMRFGLGAGRIDLFANLEARGAMAAGELRVRSVPMRLPAEMAGELKSAEGTQIPEVFFELAPLLSTPSDLYSLMVLGVRTLLVDANTTVAVALDEFLSLARQVAADHDPKVPLPQRIAKVLASDERFAEALGPHHLTGMKITAREAAEIVPAELWHEVLAAFVRAAPGIGPDSVCRDLGDADAAAVEKVFDPLLGDLYALVRKTRSMIVSDPASDAELHDLVRAFT